MRDQYERRGDLERITPGEFRESAGRNRVFFIDKDTPDGATATNVFISSIERDKQLITSARSGRIDTVGDGRYLLLSNGQRLERPLVPGPLKISEFGTYGARVGGDTAAALQDKPARSRPTAQLLADPTPVNRGELGWRLGMLLAGANFVLLALTLTSVNPRVGRSGNLMLAFFAFVVYLNLINLGQSWVASGRVGMATYLIGLHGGVLALTALWLAKRNNNWVRRARRATVPATPDPRT